MSLVIFGYGFWLWGKVYRSRLEKNVLVRELNLKIYIEKEFI